MLAFDQTFVGIGVILLFFLLREQFLNEHIFCFLLVEAPLGSLLVDGKLASSTLALFAREVALLFRLFDLIHRGWERKVLDLTRWDALFLLLAFDSVVNIDISLNSELLEVLIEFTDAIFHF